LLVKLRALMLDYSGIQIGKRYARPWLAAKWGFASYRAFAKGVFCPRGGGQINLFVTRVKQRTLQQYNDYITGEYLFWEGEKKHGHDQRIKEAGARQEEIRLFYREIHHSPFEYKGLVELIDFKPFTDHPSKFVFRLFHDQSASDDLKMHEKELVTLPETERQSIIKARVGQGIFRKELVEMWEGACAVTGVRLPNLLRASHIKPWRFSTNSERTNRYNGLLLLPQYDHLFDRGFISFDDDGRIIRSRALDRISPSQLGINETDRLRSLSESHLAFLRYHRKTLLIRHTDKN
jgi:putative restriction endonuclease